MKRTYDYLPDTQIYLYQRKDMFRMNTDTALLGHFMKVKQGESVLDIGTNNGALLLYASRLTKGKLIGVDVLKEACELAKENLRLNGVDAQIIHSDIKDVEVEKVDVIVCNPPYFQVTSPQQLNEAHFKQVARHEVYLTLDTLLSKVEELLRDYGRFYMVHRSDRICDIVSGCRAHQLEIKTMQFIKDEQNPIAHGVLIEAVKLGNAHCDVLPMHIVKR